MTGDAEYASHRCRGWYTDWVSIQDYATSYAGRSIAIEVDDGLFVANRARLVVDGAPVDDRVAMMGTVRLRHVLTASDGMDDPIAVEITISGWSGKVKAAHVFTRVGEHALERVER